MPLNYKLTFYPNMTRANNITLDEIMTEHPRFVELKKISFSHGKDAAAYALAYKGLNLLMAYGRIPHEITRAKKDTYRVYTSKSPRVLAQRLREETCDSYFVVEIDCSYQGPYRPLDNPKILGYAELRFRLFQHLIFQTDYLVFDNGLRYAPIMRLRKEEPTRFISSDLVKS